MNLLRFFLLLLAGMMILMIWGCKNDPTKPESKYPADQTPVPNLALAREYSDSAIRHLLIATDLTTTFNPQKPAVPDTSFYDPVSGWWTQDDTYEFSYLDSIFPSIRQNRFQFRNGGNVQQYRMGADELICESVISDKLVLEPSLILDLTIVLNLTVTGIDTESQTVSGSGILDHIFNSTGIGSFGEETHATNRYYILYSHTDLNYDDYGCLTGTLEIDLSPYAATITFNGSSEAQVAIKNSEGGVIERYSYPLNCGE